MDRAAIQAAVGAMVPSHVSGRLVLPHGSRGAMAAIVHWALQSSTDTRLQTLVRTPTPTIIARALRAGGWCRETSLVELLDDLAAGGNDLVRMYLDAKMRAASHKGAA